MISGVFKQWGLAYRRLAITIKWFFTPEPSTFKYWARKSEEMAVVRKNRQKYRRNW